MASITVYEISADPFSTRDVDITAAYSVEITDNDAILHDPDPDSTQLDLSGLPGFTASSQNFSTFETYTGTIDGAPVSFTLIQFTNPRYIIVTSGQAALNDTIEDTSFGGTASSTPYQSLPSFVCFTTGSLILTPTGQCQVEGLVPGDPVVTSDGHIRPVRWIGRRHLSAQELRFSPHLCPVRFKAGCFGPNSPKHDLLVSPQHRVAVTSAMMELMHGETVMLAPAKALINGQSIVQDLPAQGVEYIHILFDQHELVSVEGIWSESFYPGETTLSAMTPATLRRLFNLFPNLSRGADGYGPTVLPVLKPFEVGMLKADLKVPNWQVHPNLLKRAA
ncbi:Hint domain-containing protein [Ruegeria sp. 6PALISEP08]|uniref:Hint domain-containing protein n=1 Tax=Ruegeria sp. 6PALISEP08 TaxID=1225660 RepID=UPI00067EAE93|nr:Hint domain-containing protein [Ruegeria sp. 6PALISEP08]